MFDARNLATLALFLSLMGNVVKAWPIYYSRVSSSLSGASEQYRIDPDWAAQHVLAGTTTYGLNFPGEYDYAVFYCQNLCDGTNGCMSMFTNFDSSKPAAPKSWAVCTMFDASIKPQLYVDQSDRNFPAVGGYNKFG
ncbi:hypothetical protein MCOR25_001170 [Pyricularia grisea]|uniref:Apple domain-containing protein n=1 Tax=Pyricularia grisea TaxID=148305 RepID=A0A6P8B5P3_PYRGI|nr:hypothetical protein PgNI_05814 [Pyricularia grisea]KAI6381477.1 hypothetical protein MCOR25_001170 [Pyricularia grisea]TLD10661.1 hypothetical protein PgNI_05814 [Pyricularia grisea]